MIFLALLSSSSFYLLLLPPTGLNDDSNSPKEKEGRGVGGGRWVGLSAFSTWERQISPLALATLHLYNSTQLVGYCLCFPRHLHLYLQHCVLRGIPFYICLHQQHYSTFHAFYFTSSHRCSTLGLW